MRVHVGAVYMYAYWPRAHAMVVRTERYGPYKACDTVSMVHACPGAMGAVYWMHIPSMVYYRSGH